MPRTEMRKTQKSMSKAIAVYYCGYEKCASGHSFGPAVRTQYLLHFVISGKGTYSVGGVTYPVKAGQAFLIKPSEVTYYQADREAPWEYMWMAFDGIDGKETVRRTGFQESYVAVIPRPEETYYSTKGETPPPPPQELPVLPVEVQGKKQKA